MKRKEGMKKSAEEQRGLGTRYFEAAWEGNDIIMDTGGFV